MHRDPGGLSCAILCGVEVDLPVCDGVRIPAAELSWRFSRSSGPGGQGVNTTDSRVELSWDLAATIALAPHQRERAAERLAGRLVGSVVTVAASEYRAQLRNREAARMRLAAMLRAALAPPPRPRRPTRPTLGSRRRREESKTRRSETKRLRRDPGY